MNNNGKVLTNITLDGNNIGNESKYGKKFVPISKFDMNIIMEYLEYRIGFLKRRFPDRQEQIDKLQNISKKEILECLNQLEDMYVKNLIQLQENAAIIFQ